MIPIANFENRYKIDSTGKILNLANNTLLNPSLQADGYLTVGLANSGNPNTTLSVHRLVALHFLPNPYQHPQLNHKNGDKTDNKVENLEWCTAKHNINHALETGLRSGYMSADDKEMYLNRVLNGEQVKDIGKEIGRAPETLSKMLRETAKRLNIHHKWTAQMYKNRREAAIRNLRNAGY